MLVEEIIKETETNPSGGILRRKPSQFLELLHIEFPVFKRQAKPGRLPLNQLGFSFRLLGSKTMIDMSNDEGKVKGLTAGVEEMEEDH
jgi:hypothetical protein